MSSSQQTTNLGLPIYGNNDVPSWSDTNTPFQTLDNIIGQGALHSNIPDYSNHIASPTFSNTGSYTATQDCYIEIGGTVHQTGVGSIKVNNYQVGGCYYTPQEFLTYINKAVILQKDDVISWDNISTTTGYINVFGLL